ISAPQCLQTLTLLPSPSILTPYLTPLSHLGQTRATLLEYIAASAFTMPPASPLLRGFTLLVAMLQPSTMSLPSLGDTASTFPRLPLSLPLRMTTESPVLT